MTLVATNPARRTPSGYQPSAVGSAFDEDFDFSAGLQSFNKKKVFADIKVSRRRLVGSRAHPPSRQLTPLTPPSQSKDDTDPAHRLVAHNRLPQAMRKLAPDESVLSPAELAQQRLEHLELATAPRPPASLGGDDEGGSVYEEALEPEPVAVAAPVAPVLKKRGTGSQKVVGGGGGLGGALYSPEGVRAAAVKLRQLKEAMSM